MNTEEPLVIFLFWHLSIKHDDITNHRLSHVQQGLFKDQFHSKQQSWAVLHSGKSGSNLNQAILAVQQFVLIWAGEKRMVCSRSKSPMRPLAAQRQLKHQIGERDCFHFHLLSWEGNYLLISNWLKAGDLSLVLLAQNPTN